MVSLEQTNTSPSNIKSGTKNSVNQDLWRGELTVQDLIDLLSKMPPDAFVRLYGNKFQMISPIDNRTYTLDMVR